VSGYKGIGKGRRLEAGYLAALRNSPWLCFIVIMVDMVDVKKSFISISNKSTRATTTSPTTNPLPTRAATTKTRTTETTQHATTKTIKPPKTTLTMKTELVDINGVVVKGVIEVKSVVIKRGVDVKSLQLWWV